MLQTGEINMAQTSKEGISSISSQAWQGESSQAASANVLRNKPSFNHHRHYFPQFKINTNKYLCKARNVIHTQRPCVPSESQPRILIKFKRTERIAFRDPFQITHQLKQATANGISTPEQTTEVKIHVWALAAAEKQLLFTVSYGTSWSRVLHKDKIITTKRKKEKTKLSNAPWKEKTFLV